MRSEQEMMKIIMDTAEEDDRIRAVYMSGSRVIPNAKHDRYSDFDIVYIVRDIGSFTRNEHWVDRFGDMLIMQKPDDWYNHPYDYNGNERFAYLMQFKDGNRIDLTLVDVENIRKIIEDNEPRLILLDKDGIDGLRSIQDGGCYHIQKSSYKEFEDCCNEFWWLSLYTAKGLMRQEFMYAKSFMERNQMDMLLKMLDWEIGIEHDFSVTTGKCHKYLNRYLSKSGMDEFMNLFPDGSFENIWDKLLKMCKFFNGMVLTVASSFKFQYRREEAENIMAYLETLHQEYLNSVQ